MLGLRGANLYRFKGKERVQGTQGSIKVQNGEKANGYRRSNGKRRALLPEERCLSYLLPSSSFSGHSLINDSTPGSAGTKGG